MGQRYQIYLNNFLAEHILTSINDCIEKAKHFTDLCDQPLIKISISDIFEALPLT